LPDPPACIDAEYSVPRLVCAATMPFEALDDAGPAFIPSRPASAPARFASLFALRGTLCGTERPMPAVADLDHA
jgi:hypothetical protein